MTARKQQHRRTLELCKEDLTVVTHEKNTVTRECTFINTLG